LRKAFLRGHADPAVYRGGPQCREASDSFEVVDDLERELAGGNEHQRSRSASGSIDELMQDGKQECRGLAAAGGRAGEKVAALERRGDGFRLDGRGMCETELLDASQEGRMQLES
jgi:hypothetical protein